MASDFLEAVEDLVDGVYGWPIRVGSGGVHRTSHPVGFARIPSDLPGFLKFENPAVQLRRGALNLDLGLGEPVRWCPFDGVVSVLALALDCPISGFAPLVYYLDEVVGEVEPGGETGHILELVER